MKDIDYAIHACANIYWYGQLTINLIFQIISILLTSIYSTYFSIWYFLFIFVAIIPSLVETIIENKQLKKDNTEIYNLQNYNDKYYDAIFNIKAIKENSFFLYGDLLYGRYKLNNDKISIIKYKHRKKILVINCFFSCLKLIGEVAGFVISLILLYFKKITISEFSVGVSSYTMLLSGFNYIFELLNSRTKFQTLIAPYFDFINCDERNGINSLTFNHEIALKDVSFTYNKNNVLENINLSIKKGEKIAIVGQNGAGKSTLINLILGIYLPVSGVVLYDGIDIRTINEKSLHENQSIMSQKFNKYNLTVQENICFDEKVLVDDLFFQYYGIDFVKANELLGNEFGGRELSGGQWQKIALARAYYKKHEIIALDEPTSAIDPLLESSFYKLMFEDIINKTVIVSTHRMGAMKYVDRIIVLKDGVIIEDGNHEQLLKKQGEYYNMWMSQVIKFM